MVDGAALLTTMFHGFRALGTWHDERGTNYVDSGAHYYEVYETADGKYISVGAIEPKFYRELLMRLGLSEVELPEQLDEAHWEEMNGRFDQLFRSRTRSEWCELLEHTDVCFAPVLSMEEAPLHPHNQFRKTFLSIDGKTQPAPAPRFSRTVAAIQSPPSRPGEHTDQVLTELGLEEERISLLRDSGAVA